MGVKKILKSEISKFEPHRLKCYIFIARFTLDLRTVWVRSNPLIRKSACYLETAAGANGFKALLASGFGTF